MRRIPIFQPTLIAGAFIAFLFAACSAVAVEENDRLSCPSRSLQGNEALVDEIERRVRLPDGSNPISSYTRYYTRDEDGKIQGYYFVPEQDPFDCNELCAEAERIGVSCSEMNPISMPHQAGERVWVGHVGEMPQMSDGGCGYISFSVEDEVDHSSIKARCNVEL